jgi:cytochrome c biogenesis protein CcmG/thiol:disulfide interchange protein DsbE
VDPLPKRGLLLSGVFAGVVLVGLAVAWAIDGSAEGAVAAVGEPAPDFTVELLDGGTFSLSEHVAEDGRPLVINLWASWCVPCREEMPYLSAFAEDNPGVAVVGVAVEDRLDDARAFAAEIDPVYPLAFGDQAFDEAYPNFGLPVTYFLDENGGVTEIFNGILTPETLEEKTA